MNRKAPELQHYIRLLTDLLIDTSEPNGYGTDFYWTFVNALIVKCGYRPTDDLVALMRTGRLTDNDIKSAADGLVADWKRLNAGGKNDIVPVSHVVAAAMQLRQTGDDFRRELAIKAVKGSIEENQPGARDTFNAYVLGWIVPQGNEADGRHYTLNQIGHLLFSRLCAATKGLTGSQAAHVMAQVYDASLRAGALTIPISSDGEAAAGAQVLKSRLEGAPSSEDLGKALKLVAAYNDPNYLDRRLKQEAKQEAGR